MPYQNVSQCRFYINDLEWLDTIGAISLSNVFRTLPVEQIRYQQIDTTIELPYAISNGFVAILGHTFASEGASFIITNATAGWYPPLTNVINWGPGWETVPDYDGFTIAKFNGSIDAGIRYKHVIGGDIGWATTGSVVIGSYFDMPHSPDLSLTMSREYGGVKTIETKGGSTLSNANWTKPAPWGEAGCWELYDGNTLTGNVGKALSRSGRRVWDLSFSYLDSSEVFGPNQSLGSYALDGYGVGYRPYANEQAGVDAGYSDTDIDSSGFFNSNLLTDDNFFSLIHKTNGGQLPFIFNPEGGGTNPNNNPDMFAICKFDQNSFKFSQVANGVYNIKLKIREVW